MGDPVAAADRELHGEPDRDRGHAPLRASEPGGRPWLTHAEHFPGPIHQPPLVANLEAIQPHEHARIAHHPRLQHHFDDMAQQLDASTLGMWVFLVTEIMFFGGLFCAYLVYRHAVPKAFAEASHHLNVTLGAVNTPCSSAAR